MRVARIHCSEALSGRREVRLDADATRHLLRVLRLRKGDPVTVFDGRGGEYRGVIATTEKAGARIELGPHEAREIESRLNIALLQGVSRGSRMDLVVQKATELGVHTIIPVLTERSPVRYDAKKADAKRLHWQSVAISACEQSGRNRVPAIESPRAFDQSLSSLQTERRLLLDPTAGTALMNSNPAPGELALLIGPEGGLTATERDRARAAGYAPIRLGPRVLRTETAAIAAISVLQAIWGDLLK